eukprot:maker-scaffold_5-snap-gene-12.58-mRNA-1 protein AED:0.02 eAED:0.02 QI:104/0.5/0.66/1/1/1/3/40/303
MKQREASHAGSWYTANPKQLANELESNLNDLTTAQEGELLAIIGPHAGFFYSGKTAAYGYKYIQNLSEDRKKKLKRVFLLGPSHHFYFENCAVSTQEEYTSPIGNMKVDVEMINELKSQHTVKLTFHELSKEEDEEEHSLEMHFPYIVKTLQNANVKLVPIMVGNISTKQEKYFGGVFARYLANPENLFVVSTDFCHWGERFQYTHKYDEFGQEEIYKSIEKLDKIGVELLENLDFEGWVNYLKTTRNTVCGRHPVSILLGAICQSELRDSIELKLVKYDQSSKVKSRRDSSVSYVSAVVLSK